MFSHITIGGKDLRGLAAFYDAVLAPLGITRHYTNLDEGFVGWSVAGRHPHFFVTRPFNGAAPSPGNGNMLAFLAGDRATVDAVHALALAHGGTEEGAPGLRPQYTPDYYGAYMRDPEGNKFHVVHRGAA